jgi:serine/threonine protein kinase
MPDPHWENLKEVFHSAVALAPNERAAYLDHVCAGDASLRQAVESLIKSHEETNNFVDNPAYQAAAEMLVNSVELKPGKIIAHYRIERLLGEGGMGTVYLAQDTSLGRKVALKLLPALYTQDADRLRRFEQEARTASALNHPNIVTIYEIGHADSTHFIATEYLDGATLRAYLATMPVQSSEVLDIAVQVASALAAAHAKGVVHRDIKPENIMVLKENYSLHRENYVKVLDFGIAKLTEVTTSDAEAPTKPLIDTNQGVVLGTVSYMSPEQSRGLVVDARTDIWSLGVMLYEMLTNHLPFLGETAEDVRAAILKDKPSPLPAEIPERLKWIVAKALRKERDERYQTAREIFSDLRELQQEFTSESLREPSISHNASLDESTKSGPLVSVDALTGGTKESVARATSSAEYLIDRISGHKQGVLITTAVLLLIIVGLAYGLIGLWRHEQPRAKVSSQSMKITRLTDSGNATAAAISPDGNYLVYVVRKPATLF